MNKDKQSEWISFEEKRPEGNMNVLAAVRVGDRVRVTICKYIADFEAFAPARYESWMTNSDSVDGCKVTHWMPLPEPPKMKEGAECMVSIEKNEEKVSIYTTKERARYIGFCDHDCEAHYECPYCKKRFGSFAVFHQKENENGTKKYCPHCKKELNGLD